MIDQILKDQSDYIEIDIYYNGVLTDPTSCIIKTITNPSGSIILSDEATVAGATTGRRRYEVDSDYTATVGVYTAVWQFVISGTTFEHTQQYEVVTSIRQGYIAPQQVRDTATYGGITSTAPTDAVLTKYILKASKLIDSYLGGSLEYSQQTETVRCGLDRPNNGLHIQLGRRPIISVTSVSIETSPGSVVTLDTDNLRINTRAGYLEYFGTGTLSYAASVCFNDWASGNIIPNATVTYAAGYYSIPTDISMATAYLVEQLIREDSGDSMQLKGFKLGNYSETYSSSPGHLGIGKIGSDQVMELLREYKQPRSLGFRAVVK